MRPRYITATRSLDMLDHAEIVADHDVGQPELVLELEQQVDDLGADRDVERRDRLVADHQLGLQDQRAGDADALALAAGEFVRVAVGMLGTQADLGHHVGDAVLDLGLVGDAVDAQRIGQRAAHGLARIERGVGVLEDHLDGARASPAVGCALALRSRAVEQRCGRASAGSSPMMASARVDLPQPDSPTRPRHSPGFTSSVTPSTAFSVLDAAGLKRAADLEVDGEIVEREQGSAMVMAPHESVRPAGP